MIGRLLARLSPGQIILLSICLVIFVGTALLSLPIAQHAPVSLIDLLFTTTSSVSVTGLATVPIEHFSTFGHAIILALIQIGGLGLITLTVFVMYLILDVTISTQLMAGRLLEIESWKNIKRVVMIAITLTLLAEAIGAAVITPIFAEHMPLPEALFQALFHTVSSFCNAGITIIPTEQIPLYATNYRMLLITTILIFTGGFGFITWYEILRYAKSRINKTTYRFSLHTKIVLYTATALILSSSVLFWILEHKHSLASLSAPLTFFYAIFYSIAFKSTGTFFVDIGQLQLATLVLIMVIGFIGSSPTSTGSGIKMTVFAIFLATIRAAITGRKSTEILERHIEQDQVNRSIAIVALSILWIVTTTFLLLITEKGWNPFDILFESVTAFTTLGITTGITPHLSYIGKLAIMASMIIGRIGSFTLILALKLKKEQPTAFSYPKERVMLS